MWSSYKRSYSTAQIEKCDVTIRTLKSYRESATKLLSNNGIIYGYSYLYEYTFNICIHYTLIVLIGFCPV